MLVRFATSDLMSLLRCWLLGFKAKFWKTHGFKRPPTVESNGHILIRWHITLTAVKLIQYFVWVYCFYRHFSCASCYNIQCILMKSITFFTSCIHLRPFNIPISLAMTCNKSDGVKGVWAESTVYYDIKHAWMKTKERKKYSQNDFAKLFFFPLLITFLQEEKRTGERFKQQNVNWFSKLCVGSFEKSRLGCLPF